MHYIIEWKLTIKRRITAKQTENDLVVAPSDFWNEELLSKIADIRPPGKNWPQAFYKRHLEFKAMRVKALDWERHDHHIYDKVVDWFAVIKKELANPLILVENIYNMDETGVLLSAMLA